ncbi:MAG: CAP domain-containing protein [Microgenomates group bacterium]
MAKHAINQTKLALIFTLVWFVSVILFLLVSSASSEGSYTEIQNIILISTVIIGIISFLVLFFYLNIIYKNRRDKRNLGTHSEKVKSVDRETIFGKISKSMILLAIGLFGGFYGSNYYYRVTKIDPAYIEISSYTDMVRLINKERVAVGLKPLTENKLLDESAKAKACDMRDNNYFEHVSPDGKQPWYFIKKAGYDYYHAGENIARDYNNSTKRTATAYMNSEEHRDNILDPAYTEVGIGQCGVFSVEHFANRQLNEKHNL